VRKNWIGSHHLELTPKTFIVAKLPNDSRPFSRRQTGQLSGRAKGLPIIQPYHDHGKPLIVAAENNALDHPIEGLVSI
jgi:hypothetical protein